MAPRQELADGRGSSPQGSSEVLLKARPGAVNAMASGHRRDAAVERREARPARVMGWVISGASGDGSHRETDHRVRRIRTSACRRSAPSFCRGGEKTQGSGALPQRPARRSVGCAATHHLQRTRDDEHAPPPHRPPRKRARAGPSRKRQLGALLVENLAPLELVRQRRVPARTRLSWRRRHLHER
jgi:hypothetical protein